MCQPLLKFLLWQMLFQNGATVKLSYKAFLKDVKGTFLNYVIRLGWVGVRNCRLFQLLLLLGGWVLGKMEFTNYFSLRFYQCFFLYFSGKKVFSEKKQSNFCLQTSIEQLQNFFLLLICFKLSLTKQLKLNKGRLSCWLKYHCSCFSLIAFS